MNFKTETKNWLFISQLELLELFELATQKRKHAQIGDSLTIFKDESLNFNISIELFYSVEEDKKMAKKIFEISNQINPNIKNPIHAKERNEGYYWIKMWRNGKKSILNIKPNLVKSDWVIGYWNKSGWKVVGYDFEFCEQDIVEISPTQILTF